MSKTTHRKRRSGRRATAPSVGSGRILRFGSTFQPGLAPFRMLLLSSRILPVWWARGLIVITLLAVGLGGCGDEESPKGACFDYVGWDGSSPTVSLETDLLGDKPSSGLAV